MVVEPRTGWDAVEGDNLTEGTWIGIGDGGKTIWARGKGISHITANLEP